MTNFEIAVERDFPLNDGQAGILFHFLSVIDFIPSEYHTGSRGVLHTSFLSAGLLQILLERSAPSFASACPKSNPELVRLCPGSGICNSFTNRIFPRHITTQDVRSGLFGD